MRIRIIRSDTQFSNLFHHLGFISLSPSRSTACHHLPIIVSLSSSPFRSFHLFRPPRLIFIWTSSSFFSSFEPGSDRIGSVSRSLLVSISGACSPSRFLCVHAFHPHVYSASSVHRSFLSVFFLILLASINSDRRGKPKSQCCGWKNG
jgi:hypothetical protein